MEGNTVTLKLSQEDTFLFEDDITAAVQMRIRLSDGEVIASDVHHCDLNVLLDDEVVI